MPMAYRLASALIPASLRLIMEPKEKFQYIDSEEDLHRACAELADAKVLYLDTEFHREKTYYPHFALLQIADREHCYLIDPLAIKDMRPVWELLLSPASVKVFHAARQDLEIIMREAGSLPLPLFDTQIAAALLGYGQQVGFGNLVQRLAKTSLPKLESFSDWLGRPLAKQQLVYAADDVIYLRPVYQALLQELEATGRHGWVQEEMSSLCDPTTYDNDCRHIFWRVKGVTRLKGQQLAVLRELACWREHEAKRLDIPRKRVISDESLVELARRPNLSLADMERMRGLNSGLIQRFGQALIAAWQKGHACPKAEWPCPAHRERLSDGTEVRLELLDALMRLRADEARIAPHLLASRDELSQLASWAGHRSRMEPDIPCLHGWRRTLIGDDLLRMSRGELCMRLDTSTGRPLIERIHPESAP
jgi:ribonuclease D